MLRKTKHSRKPFWPYSKSLNYFKCIHFHYLEILYLENSAFQKHIHNRDEQRRSRNLLLKLCAKELRWLRVKVDVSIPNQSWERVSLRSVATDSLLSPLMLWFLSRSDWECRMMGPGSIYTRAQRAPTAVGTTESLLRHQSGQTQARVANGKGGAEREGEGSRAPVWTSRTS